MRPFTILITTALPQEYKACCRLLNGRAVSEKEPLQAATGVIGNQACTIIRSGYGKTDAAAATAYAIARLAPDLVIDAGTCGGLAPGIRINDIVLADSCHEYDVTGNGFPVARKNMKIRKSTLPLSRVTIDRFAATGTETGVTVVRGEQACGEFIIRSVAWKEALHTLLGASACDWETAGVFAASALHRIPCLSIRVVSDLADGNATADFIRNMGRSMRLLAGYLAACCASGCFSGYCAR